MKKRLEEICQEAEARMEKAESLQELSEIRREYLGTKRSAK